MYDGDTIAGLPSHHGTHFLGRFKNGQAHGHFWIGMINNGFIHGVVNEEGLATGDKIAYIYPDGETAFLGKFENKFMRKAYNVDVKSYGCDENGMLVVKEFSEPLSSQEFYYEPCTNESYGGGAPLHVRDPYEVKTVKLAPSSVPNSGQGVFLLKDVPTGRFASIYSLFLYRHKDQMDIYLGKCSNNITKSNDYRRECKKYSLGLSSFMARIDLPPEFDVNPLPNLGPKVNHHFRFNNSVYMELEHPRWGLIQSVTTTRDIKAGKELFTNYGYGKNDFPDDFPWYWEKMRAQEKEERLLEEAALKEQYQKKNKKKKQQKKMSSKKKS
jgi:hypothetical protein